MYEVITPDFMTFGEDMSYNNGPMISEDSFDEFLLPYYEKIVPYIKAHGTKVIVDTDGDVSKMIPWLMRAGIEGVLPLERQAGVDVVALRELYPKFIFIGAFDKMTMRRGVDDMRAEFERLLPVMKTGGFIPSVDHQTPPDVPLERYKIYVEMLKEYAEKAVKG
jgi:uroporphyrinogen-III decarboxylase